MICEFACNEGFIDIQLQEVHTQITHVWGEIIRRKILDNITDDHERDDDDYIEGESKEGLKYTQMNKWLSVRM